MAKRSSFEAGLPAMMYGYGDAKTPDPESVALVSKLVRGGGFTAPTRERLRLGAATFAVQRA